MRKFHQKQFLELIGTIKEANHLIERFIKKQSYDEALRLLIDCQDGAISIGNRIERFEGEGTKTVTYLEEYCDLLYQASVEISEGKEWKKTMILLHNQIMKIEESLINDINADELEVLFLPYKAEMWDSMESVWLAAKENKRCNTYVVPIPYFDRRQDGSLGEMHYEIDRYPDYVPVVDYRTYDLEARHPDIIFIHNPYDEGNYVTSIHPDYYCPRLKSCCDQLCYIPYFVAPNDVPSHFILTPGVLYADKVFLQSERIRRKYIQVFEEFERTNNCRGKFGDAEKKFIATGSPKFDKIINIDSQNFNIPYEWRRLIERPDGIKKKVVIYNTNINGILQGNEKAITKIKSVFECFRKREDVVLLWRPHPLNNATISSMRPHMANAYLQLIDQFRKEKIGIYDDTPDMYLALGLSSGYFGDSSSLVALYQCTGKPIMLQNINIDSVNSNIELIGENLYLEKDSIWFTHYKYNGLFQFDRQSYRLKHVETIPGENPTGKRLYGSITGCGDKIFLAPTSANAIVIYSSRTKEFSKVELKPPGEFYGNKYSSTWKFYQSFKLGRFVYFIPCTYPAIVRYDTENGEIKYYTDWVEPLEKRLGSSGKVYFYRGATINKNTIIMAARDTNAVVFFDIINEKSCIYDVGEKNRGYSGICCDEKGNLYLTPWGNDCIVKWNPISGYYKEIKEFPEGFVPGEYPFLNCIYANDHVWLIPQQANMALKIYTEDDTVSVAKELQPECQIVSNKSNYLHVKAEDNIIYAFTGKSGHFIECDLISNTRTERALSISKDDKELYQKVCYGIISDNGAHFKKPGDSVWAENNPISLDTFLDYIVYQDQSPSALERRKNQSRVCKKTISNPNGNAGQTILELSLMDI
ncbi:MAG: hypothetical protein GX022_07350 [Clostridiaceae bacterium]|nr:hypothetical protein [Clostridiaceae bacterium]